MKFLRSWRSVFYQIQKALGLIPYSKIGIKAEMYNLEKILFKLRKNTYYCVVKKSNGNINKEEI